MFHLSTFRQSVLAAFALCGAAAAGAFAFGSGPLAASAYAVALVVLLAHGMARLWTRPLEVVREVSAPVTEIGEPVNVVAKLRNRSILPMLWAYVEETLPEGSPVQGTSKRFIFLPPGRAFHLHYSVIPNRRGLYQLGPAVVETGDVFGLFRRSRVLPRLDFFTATPGYAAVDPPEPGQVRRIGNQPVPRGLFEDPTRIRGVREYRRGDPLKRIHWKSSARTGRLRSKVHDAVEETGAMVVLDLRRASWDGVLRTDPARERMEEAVELAATLARYLTDGGWPAGLLSNGLDPLGLPGVGLAQAAEAESLSDAFDLARRRKSDGRLEPVMLPPRRGPEQFALIHEQLGRLTPSAGLPIEEHLALQLPRIDRQIALLAIVGIVEDGLVEALARARMRGYRILAFVMGNAEDHDRAFGALTARGVEVFRMDQSWRIKEIATGRRAF